MSASAPHPAFIQAYLEGGGPYAALVTEHRSAGTAPTRLVATRQPAGAYPDAPGSDLVLGLLIGGAGTNTIDVGAGRWRGRCSPGDMALIPPGVATDFRQEAAQEFLFMGVPAAALDGALGERPIDFGHLHATPFRDGFVEVLCRRLWDEAAQGNPFGVLFADGALLVLASALLRLAGHPGATASGTAAPPAATPRLRRALDLVEDRLGEDLALGDLASAAALSPRQLVRAFHAATGTSPHTYLMTRRVERARHLLAHTDHTLVEIASECGFKSQSHFGQAFRRVVGMTPGAYRRARRA